MGSSSKCIVTIFSLASGKEGKAVTRRASPKADTIVAAERRRQWHHAAPGGGSADGEKPCVWAECE